MGNKERRTTVVGDRGHNMERDKFMRGKRDF